MGRPHCRRACCTSPSFLRYWYLEAGMSAGEIAEMIWVSSTHIVKRLKEEGLPRRGRGAYRGRKRRPRDIPLTRLSEEELTFGDLGEIESKLVSRSKRGR